MTQTVDKLRDRHRDETVYIVGCGPSLLFLKAEHFGMGPVISISESIKKVESLGLANTTYSFQKDAGVIVPERATLVVNEQEHDSYTYLPDYEPRYSFLNERDFGIPWNTISALTAAKFAKVLGCNKIVMVCCDVNVTGDMRTCIFKDDGSYEITEPNAEYYVHKSKLKQSLSELDIEIDWILPEGVVENKRSKIKLIICTLFYEMKGWSAYIESLFETTKFLARHTDIEFDFWALSGASYVSDARNMVANRFLKTDYTHLLFIDSDESWDLPGLVKMIAAPYDLVGAGYPCKNMWNFYGCLINCEDDGRPIVDQSTGLISVTQMPGGFMRIAKTVFEKLKPHVTKQTVTNDAGEESEVWDFFSRKYPHGEDASFLMRCGIAGIKRWIEPRITITHWGVKGYTGNYHNLLCSQPGGSDYIPAMLDKLQCLI